MRFVPARASLSAVSLITACLAQVPSPSEFLGHEVGADYELCNYTDLVRYFRAVEKASDRVQLVDIGKTSYGQRMLMAVISSPANLRNLERLRETSVRMAHPGDLDAAGAQRLAGEGRAVVWIDAGLHANETIAAQNIIELVWRMASRTDEEVERILDEVVLLACPVNPDGYELVANAYRATRSTVLPVLYQRYIGHDNNRDFYACNQLEAQNVSRVFYRDWCPQIVYNHHQTAPRGTILFTPPFRDPFNYLIDPLVVRGIEIVSAHMNHRFALEQKPGVISRSGAPYSAWWNGGLRSTGYFHNIIGILTEAFGRPEPTPVKQALSRRLPYHDYPEPVASQMWHARQTVEYLQTANFAILDYAAKHRRDLLRSMHTMASRAIERGRGDHWTPTPRLASEARLRDDDSVWSDPAFRDPRAYVLRSDQRNWSAATRFARALWHGGVDLHRARQPFDFDGERVPAGSFVILCDQPYRAHVLDMMEPQWHPDDIRNGKPVPPYDAAGWTLAMQMDVDVMRSYEAVTGPFELLSSLPDFDACELPVSADCWQLDARDLHTLTAVNRLLAAGQTVEWSSSVGRYVVPVTPRASTVLARAARELGVRAEPAGPGARASVVAVDNVRVGLFDVFGGHMPTGWDRWLLEQFEFPVQTVWGERVQAGDLRRDYDVLIFHTGLPGPRDLNRAARRRAEAKIPELREALPPFEDWSDLEARTVRLTGDKALPALREFVRDGGTLLALGREVDKVVRHFDLPVEVGTYVATPTGGGEVPSGDAPDDGKRKTTRDEYYVPGSLLAINVDTSHAIARGAPPELAAMMYRSSKPLEVTDADAGIDVVARFRREDPLLSGWAIGTEFLDGKAAVLSANVGRGRGRAVRHRCDLSRAAARHRAHVPARSADGSPRRMSGSVAAAGGGSGKAGAWGVGARPRAPHPQSDLDSQFDMLRKLISFAACSALALIAQEPPVAQDPAPDAAPQVPAPPQANSLEARKMVDQAIDKMIAYGRGTFATSETQDSAMMRRAGAAFGGNAVEVDGGWHRNLVWGDWDGREFVTGNGRMLAKVDDGWRLRRSKLAGGMQAPFTLDPDYLFAAIKQLPAAARNIVHVEEGKLRGRRAIILSMQFEGDDALEFSDSGAVPDAGGGFGGGMIMVRAMGGMGMEPPRPDLTTYLAFFVDAENGDLLRFGCKTYSADQMMGNIQIAVGGMGGDDDDDEEDDDEEEAEPAGPMKWKRGFPKKKPTDEESVVTFRADFKKHGLAEPPALDAELKSLLRPR